MKLFHPAWPRFPSRELATIHTTGAVFALLLVSVLSVGRGLTGHDPSVAPGVDVKPAAPAPDDLEPLIVDVAGSGETLRFRLGSREFATVAELARALGPPAASGLEVFVRVSHDVPFARADEAIQACHAAGFRSVSLSTAAR